MNLLNTAMNHADRAEPLRYHAEAWLLGERKSIDPERMLRKHQSMHHIRLYALARGFRHGRHAVAYRTGL